MIPKIIHYCWFGNNKKSKVIKKCINSWKKMCPDYKIIEWNENNFNINCNIYVKQAYENKKWAFVSDYARFWIVYNYGGIYLDTDVELIQSLDCVLNNKFFVATENNINISTGLGFGAEKRNKIVKKMLDDYNNVSFLNEDGTFNMTTCVIRNTESIKKYLDKIPNKNEIYVSNDFTYYPKEYFCPYNSLNKKMNITSNTIGIHWFSASWLPLHKRIKNNFLIYIKNLLGEEKYNRFKKKLKK